MLPRHVVLLGGRSSWRPWLVGQIEHSFILFVVVLLRIFMAFKFVLVLFVLNVLILLLFFGWFIFVRLAFIIVYIFYLDLFYSLLGLALPKALLFGPLFPIYFYLFNRDLGYALLL